jgi:CRISPR-associated protein Csb3
MPEHQLLLDPCNPGQFFACCGLFELAELVSPGGEAWFTDSGRAFVIATEAHLPPASLSLAPRASGVDAQDVKIEPLELAVGEHRLALNWWLNDTLSAKSPLKTWGGPQTPRGVLEELLRLLDFSAAVGTLNQSFAYTTSRCGVDARSAWDALDLGYSPNDESRKADKQAVTFPWIEVLAAAGLQGFRPAEASRSRYRYNLWLTPLPLSVARAVCAAAWPGLPSRSFVFEIATRGQGYKTFSSAKGVDHV